MSHIDQIIANIDARIAELQKDIAPLEAARDALDAKRAPRRGRKTDRRPPANGAKRELAAQTMPAAKLAKARRVRPKPAKPLAVVPAAKLELLLSSSDALTTTAIAEQADGDRAQVLKLLREMEGSGKVRRTGQRRGTRWHLITEEHRIQARAAELEAQRRAA